MTHPALVEATSDAPNDLRKSLGEVVMAIDRREHMRRIDRVMSLSLPSAAELADSFMGAHASLVGSGPSAAQTVDKIPYHSNIVAVNAAHDWLVSRGVIPKIAIMLDPNSWCVNYQTPRRDVIYILGTTVHPSVWDRFIAAGVAPFVVVPILEEGDAELVAKNYPHRTISFLSGGVTTGMRAFYKLASMGFGMVDGHGFDSCYAPGGWGNTDDTRILYAHHKPATVHNARSVTIASRRTGDKLTFIATAAMARQVLSFQVVMASLGAMGVNANLDTYRRATATDAGGCDAREATMAVRIFGDGAIPWMAWKDGSKGYRFWHAEPELMEEKYGTSPHWDYAKDKALTIQEVA